MTIRDLSALIKTAKGTLSADPQSGGILKVLAAAGFGEKIMHGADTGHAYQVLHAPGERNFVLMDRWTEKEGRVRTMYHPFVITDEGKLQKTSTKKQTSNIEPKQSRSLRDAIPLVPSVAVTAYDKFSGALDDMEHSLDEFLSFARA